MQCSTKMSIALNICQANPRTARVRARLLNLVPFQYASLQSYREMYGTW